MAFHVSLESYLIVSAALFVCGMYAVMTRRNAVWILMGIELILNSASLNFTAFSRYIEHQPGVDPAAGMVGSILIIILAAAEAAVALAILISIYRNFRTIETEDMQELKG